MNKNILHTGDTIVTLRYDLGKCKIIEDEKGLVYESLKTGQQVHWTKMIDAITGNQKVYKEE